MVGMGIGELAQRTGVRVPNIRFYEEKGLLPAPARRQSVHRSYGARDVGRVNFIRASANLDSPSIRSANCSDWHSRRT